MTDRCILDEHHAKKLLKTYGIPVVEEVLIHSVSQAEEAVEQFRFPVVLKGVAADVPHKSDHGLVRLNLFSAAAVRAAAQEMSARSPVPLEGFLIQPQVSGQRELVAGFLRDPNFGPAVMIGWGGVFAEAFSDVTFRIAPLSERDVHEMLSELHSKPVLAAFRGLAPVNMDRLVGILTALSKIGLSHPEISEIDINPIIISDDGELCAVDALVVTDAARPAPRPSSRVEIDRLMAFFHPKSIAFVGASDQFGKWGHLLVVNTIGQGYRGEIYLVNPKGGRMLGRPVYRSVEDLPASVDLGVVTLPSSQVINLIDPFAMKGIRNMLLISSGFGEAGEQGKRLEEDLVAAARSAGILILGPNTMGIANPHIGLFCTGLQLTPKPGGTAVIAQSGNMGAQLVLFSERENIGIRAFCGSGNEAMVTIEDCMAAFGADETTKVLLIYLESVKDGPRFLEIARRLTPKKPIILLKGGRSGAGNRAAAGHTGALGSDARVFYAACRQVGIVTVTQPMALLDQAAAFSSLPLPRGNRVAVMTSGGGWGVVTADLCADYGLELPPLSREIISRLDPLLPAYWSRSNPVDMVGEQDFELPLTIMETLIRWDACDALISLGTNDRWRMVHRLTQATQLVDPDCKTAFLAEITAKTIGFERVYIEHVIRLMEVYQKPIFCVSLMKGAEDKTLYEIEGATYKGLFFHTPEQAAKTISKMLTYRRFLYSHKESSYGEANKSPGYRG